MIVRRGLLSAVAVSCTALGLLAAPPASAEGSAPAASPSVIVCNQVVALGSTTACDLPDAGMARYRFSVPSADTVRFRAAVPDGNLGRSLTLSKGDGTVICTKQSFPQFDCAVPAGGSYRL